MKPLNEMSDKEFEAHLKTIVPHIPIWMKACPVAEAQESFTDRNGNKATVCKILWIDKNEVDKESIAWVRWK